jgi:hypothetical protein
MQSHARIRMAFEHLDERPIAARKRLLEYVIEIAGWLMRVDEQNQM